MDIGKIIVGKIICADIGAKGGFKDLLQFHDYIHLHTFEPNPNAFSELSHKKHLRIPYVKHNNIALSASDGHLYLHVLERESMSSVLLWNREFFESHLAMMHGSKKWQKEFKLKNTIEISCKTLDHYAAENRIDFFDFVKIDTQGYDLEVLKGASGLLRNGCISVIKVEVSNVPAYENQACFSDIDLFLKSYGYEFVDCLFYPEVTREKGNVANEIYGFKEKPRFSFGGDAIYMLPGHVLKEPEKKLNAGLILGSMGYFQESVLYLEQTGRFQVSEIKEIIKFLNRKKFELFKTVIMAVTPPVLFSLTKTMIRLIKKAL